MKLNKVLAAAAVATAAMVGAPAHAQPIIGAMTVNGAFDAGGLGLPGSMVSLLTLMNVNNTFSTGISTSGHFTPDGLAMSFDFNVTTLAPQLLYTFNGFAFTLTGVSGLTNVPMNCTTQQCLDKRSFNGVGTVTGNGFLPTVFTMAWSANGVCNELGSTGTCGSNITAGWTASIASTGITPPVTLPEPASLALAGLALAGIALTRKAKKA